MTAISFARNGVVCIAMNYRVGIEGFSCLSPAFRPTSGCAT